MNVIPVSLRNPEAIMVMGAVSVTRLLFRSVTLSGAPGAPKGHLPSPDTLNVTFDLTMSTGKTLSLLSVHIGNSKLDAILSKQVPWDKVLEKIQDTHVGQLIADLLVVGGNAGFPFFTAFVTYNKTTFKITQIQLLETFWERTRKVFLFHSVNDLVDPEGYEAFSRANHQRIDIWL